MTLFPVLKLRYLLIGGDLICKVSIWKIAPVIINIVIQRV